MFAKLLLEKFENSDFESLNSINKSIFEVYLACLFDFDSYKYGRGVDDLGLLSEAYTKNFNNEFFDEYKAMYIKFENYPKGSGDYIQLFVDESGDYTKKSIYQSQELYYVDYGKTSIRENDSYYHDCNEYVEKNGDFILAHENAYGHLIEYDGIDEFNEFLKDNEFVEMIINYRNNIWLPLKIKSYEEYIEKERKEEERINAMKNKEPKIGMTAEEVEYGAWGKPDKINKDTYSWGTTEQWVYKKGYVYFQNGRVTSVSESF